MWFVVEPLKGDTPPMSQYPRVVLARDDWDDYGYKTTFTAVIHLSSDDRVKLGDVKILTEDQLSGFTSLPAIPFEGLGANYCSVGTHLTYYQKLFDLGPNVYEPYLTAIGDIVFDDSRRSRFEDLEGYRVSLMRFSGADRVIADARKFFRRLKPPTKRTTGFLMKFKTKLAESAGSLLVEFDFRRHRGLPNRINAVIGYNGTGKTRLLSNLAIVASGYGYADKEDLLEFRAGRFVDSPPPTRAVVVVSYSAFDTFVIPGATQVEQARIEASGDLFGYVYCGLRKRSETGDPQQPNSYMLKSPKEIEVEFINALSRVEDRNRSDILASSLDPILKDASFQRIAMSGLFHKNSQDDLIDLFRNLSSGHKIVLKIVAELVAHVEDTEPTLVLVDEPETHLHPPLVAALIKCIRNCLEQFNGYAVIATHSPVVLQETPSRYVHVVRRVGGSSRVAKPSIETFGENIGVITQEVFNLNDDAADWHDTLRRLAKRHDLSTIEEMFDNRLGFTARSYIAGEQDDEG